jgi:hypothetical protein
MTNAQQFEYMFHTHPPTPKIAGRITNGILYEIPSVSDVFHFIDHCNADDSVTHGSLIVTPEGLYNIRRLDMTLDKIKIDEKSLFQRLHKKCVEIQNNGIKKHGIKRINVEYFYNTISVDTFFVDEYNKILNEYGIHLDYYSRIHNDNDEWILDDIYLPIIIGK